MFALYLFINIVILVVSAFSYDEWKEILDGIEE